MNEEVIRLKNVVKRYPLNRSLPGFKEYILNWKKFHTQRKASYFQALKEISFTVHTGECVGIIGSNGAGKSTLLSLILGTARPTSGSVLVRKRPTPLLELGAGFHNDLTGRENIFINGVLMGLTASEVSKHFDAIVAYSGLNDFIDMPVRTFSNGMTMRLAFSIAIHTHPELLLIDEVLAVGDEQFHKKSKETLLSLVRSGVTTVLVSHELDSMEQLCSRVLWLDHGSIVADGEPRAVMEQYRAVAGGTAGREDTRGH
jgi:ABC-type polysaccharide/polyol phosphate transport system ATPase subunit